MNTKQLVDLPDRYPEEILDYMIVWDKRLSNDIISSSAFTVQNNSTLIIVANSYSNTTSTVWLAGGTASVLDNVKGIVNTVGGRTMEVMLRIKTLPSFAVTVTSNTTFINTLDFSNANNSGQLAIFLEA